MLSRWTGNSWRDPPDNALSYPDAMADLLEKEVESETVELIGGFGGQGN